MIYYAVYTNKEKSTWTDGNGKLNTYEHEHHDIFTDIGKAKQTYKYLIKNCSYKQVFVKEIDLDNDTIKTLDWSNNNLQHFKSINESFSNIVNKEISSRTTEKGITFSFKTSMPETAFRIILDSIITKESKNWKVPVKLRLNGKDIYKHIPVEQ